MSGDAKATVICFSIVFLIALIICIAVNVNSYVITRYAIKAGYVQVAVPKTNGVSIVWRKSAEGN
jgi:hypothetical protein